MNKSNKMKNTIKRILFRPGIREYRIRGGALRGLRFEFDLRHDTQAWRGIYEQRLQEWLLNHVTPGDTCLDIGGADGYFALLMAKLSGPQGEVHSFEPSEKIDRIQRNFALNRDTPLAPLARYEAFVGAEENSHKKILSIDGLVEAGKIDTVNVVKIDVDGGEIEVLQGMTNTIERFHPHLFVETHSRQLQDKVAEITKRYGYSMRLEMPAAHELRPGLDFNGFYYSEG